MFLDVAGNLLTLFYFPKGFQLSQEELPQK
jgi:hypothetical protein